MSRNTNKSLIVPSPVKVQTNYQVSLPLNVSVTTDSHHAAELGRCTYSVFTIVQIILFNSYPLLHPYSTLRICANLDSPQSKRGKITLQLGMWLFSEESTKNTFSTSIYRSYLQGNSQNKASWIYLMSFSNQRRGIQTVSYNFQSSGLFSCLALLFNELICLSEEAEN